MNDINYSEIGNKIKQKRRELGYSQEELAEICGISASYIGHRLLSGCPYAVVK